MQLTLEDLYNRITGDEDARVCKDIPEAACNDQPRNFFAYLVANLLGKVADEIASARLVIPWMFGAACRCARTCGCSARCYRRRACSAWPGRR